MSRFLKVFKFELKTALLNKRYLGVTLFLMAVIIVVMYVPNIINLVKGDKTPEKETSEESYIGEESILLIGGDGIDFEKVSAAIKDVFPSYIIEQTNLPLSEMKERIISKEAEGAVYFSGLKEYTYVIENVEMYDDTPEALNLAVENLYRKEALESLGIDKDQAENILSSDIIGNIETLGVNRMENFFYTYIMIFALYMCIIMYGNMIAMSVATEKSSRAMELLITSVKPQSMMFGKVFASCLAGFVQLVLVFGTAVIAYGLNGKTWGNNMIITSVFSMPISLFVYLLLFFVLGFMLYGFLLGAAGSTVSKMEEINVAILPVTYLFVIAFIVVMMSMASGNIDSVLMKVCSFIPFTSPMAMFTRIAMGDVPIIEIATSLGILVVSVVIIGILAAKIYRVGVLLYGVKPGIKTIVGALKRA